MLSLPIFIVYLGSRIYGFYDWNPKCSLQTPPTYFRETNKRLASLGAHPIYLAATNPSTVPKGIAVEDT